MERGIKLNVFITYSFGNVVRLNPVFKSYYSDLTLCRANSRTAGW